MDSKKAVKQLLYLQKQLPKETRRLAADGWDKDWKTLIATILSAQTRDLKTIEICDRLFSKYDSVEKLGKAKLKDVENIIHSVNYYKTKSKNIINTSKIISEKFGGKVPDKIEGLLELPGVGRKTANVFLAVVYDAPSIGVDTHVSRISQKLGWTKNKEPEKIEKDLEKLFPKRYWNKINWILVRFGQTYFTYSGKGREDEIFSEMRI